MKAQNPAFAPLRPPILGDITAKSPGIGGLKPSGHTRKGGHQAGKDRPKTYVYTVALPRRGAAGGEVRAKVKTLLLNLDEV